MRLISVALCDYENFSTAKISRFTVSLCTVCTQPLAVLSTCLIPVNIKLTQERRASWIHKQIKLCENLT